VSALLGSMYLIYKHLKHWTVPSQQTHIVRILLMVSPRSVSSTPSLSSHHNHHILLSSHLITRHLTSINGLIILFPLTSTQRQYLACLPPHNSTSSSASASPRCLPEVLHLIANPSHPQVPVYAIDSFLSLRWRFLAVYLNVLRYPRPTSVHLSVCGLLCRCLSPPFRAA